MGVGSLNFENVSASIRFDLIFPNQVLPRRGSEYIFARPIKPHGKPDFKYHSLRSEMSREGGYFELDNDYPRKINA